MSTQPPTPSDANPLNLVNGNSQDVKVDFIHDTSGRAFSAPSEPMREDQVQNAVNFLSHPRVRGSPVIYRRSFLEKKGLTVDEIDEAFRRFPDPPSNATTVDAATTNQAIQTQSPSNVQHQAPIQAPQPVAAPVNIASMVPSSKQSRFRWSRALIAAGVLAASGAGTAAFFKSVIVPRVKTWIRKVVAEENESEHKDKSRSILAEQAAVAAKAAATAAATVSRVAEELLISRTEERKYFEVFMGIMDVQVKELKTMGEAICKLERKENVSYQGKSVHEYGQSTIGNGTTNNSWRTSRVGQSDSSLSSLVPTQTKLNGTPNAENGTVRPKSASVTAEPESAPHPKSFMEIMAMVQRGEKPSNIRDIDDTPPNPDHPLPKPLVSPRPKPWEVPGQNSRSNGMAGPAEDASKPWWRRKPPMLFRNPPLPGKAKLSDNGKDAAVRSAIDVPNESK